MDTKICRICGSLSRNHANIFKTDGLKNKIETCLPIVVSPHILLPDTICLDCLENVENFFNFIKNCLQNIIILETQYDVHESCLKTKRKFDKGCSVSLTSGKEDKNVQTDYLDILTVTSEGCEDAWFPKNIDDVFKRSVGSKLVEYDIETDSDNECSKSSQITANSDKNVMNGINNYIDRLLSSKNNIKPKYFDDVENNLISEITQRKGLKRKGDIIENQRPKIFKMDSSNRRKNKQPKKVDYKPPINLNIDRSIPVIETIDNVAAIEIPPINKDLLLHLPQICLLCESQFIGAAALAAHVFEVHGIDMAEVAGQVNDSIKETSPFHDSDKKKKIPNLVKISDLKKDSPEDNLQADINSEDPPTLVPSFVCPTCPAMFTSKSELFVHLRLKHIETSSLLCGICLHQATTHQNLKSHVETCAKTHPTNFMYTCQVCFYGDNSFKLVENHVLVHDFLLWACKKQSTMFDPADYVKCSENSPKNWYCTECQTDDFDSFKSFSTHMRSQHSRFYCDLCNKYYGRNSHLWKHVNRLHKGHPSITCQICYKTSASKYHLQQHFNKIHSQKSIKNKGDLLISNTDAEDFMSQKFQAFDFQSVKQSFMKQELLEQQKNCVSDLDDNSNNRLSDHDEEEIKQDMPNAPKEIDSSSNLYTNIITNYTPPVNTGDYKCPKCGKGFQKKPLLKKHKKNCRPRLQKDLLTRCKSCARIFKDRQSLTKHLDNYHSEYVCEICNQKVQSKCEIVSHIRFTHPNCHLICKICGNILRSRDDLTKHLQNHSESFICQFCADSIPSKIKLKMHILSLHRKILSLSCGICLKLFETQHILRDHVKLVHKDKLSPLTSCPVCGKNYGSKWKTFDHLNKSHGRIFKACRICLEVFDNPTQLEIHSETVHMKHTQKNNFDSRNKIKNDTNVDIEEFTEKCNKKPEETLNESEDNISEDEEDQDYESSEEENHVPQMLTNEHKISLLEKRLAGKKVAEDAKSIVQNRQTNQVGEEKKSPKSKLKKEKSITKSFDDTELHNSSNPQHNSSKRTVYVNSNDPSHCEICFKHWPAKKHLWQHYIRCHKTVAATVCGICLKTNDNYKTLQMHLQQNHPTLLHGQGFGSNFICRICGRYHNASSKLKLHMAIHENFDWSILSEQGNMQEQSVSMDKSQNGFYQYDIKEEEVTINEESINYDDDIEQVECSSQSDNEDSDGDHIIVKDESSSVEEDEDEEAEDDESDNEESCKSMKTQMLHNMLQENQILNTNNDESSEESNSTYSDDIKMEVKSEDSEDTDTQVSGVSNHVTYHSNSNTADSLITTGSIFRCKPEELDSAIKSISYGCIEQVNDNEMDEYCEIQAPTLNENELESAVGSIL